MNSIKGIVLECLGQTLSEQHANQSVQFSEDYVALVYHALYFGRQDRKIGSCLHGVTLRKSIIFLLFSLRIQSTSLPVISYSPAIGNKMEFDD